MEKIEKSSLVRHSALLERVRVVFNNRLNSLTCKAVLTTLSKAEPVQQYHFFRLSYTKLTTLTLMNDFKGTKIAKFIFKIVFIATILGQSGLALRGWNRQVIDTSNAQIIFL